MQGEYKIETDGNVYYLRVKCVNSLFINVEFIDQLQGTTVNWVPGFNAHSVVDDCYVLAPKENEKCFIPFGTEFFFTYKDVTILRFRPIQAMNVYAYNPNKLYKQTDVFNDFSINLVSNVKPVDSEHYNGQINMF